MMCFFIGHRDAESSLMPQIEAEVERHIVDCGVEEFVVGQYGAFDRMAARTVIEIKKRYPQIKLSILLPYHPGERGIRAPAGFDSTFYPPGMESVPRRLAIIRANEYMIKHCGFLIAYAWQRGSNALRLLELAQQQKGITITELKRG